jgi:nitroreductase
MDKYQERYLKHQRRKKMLLAGKAKLITTDKLDLIGAFFKLTQKRQSQRFFNNKKIIKRQIDYIKNSIINTPSSCNRQAIQIKIIRNKKEKKKLEELLVGGKGWVSNANIIFLLLADMKAYKSPAEVNFMPYLDAGFIGMNVYYASEALGLGTCFVNPNIREEKRKIFNKLFSGGYKFCGACAIGNYDKRTLKSKKTNDIFLKNKSKKYSNV